jgi:succinate dehydrogenase / fumarate reductase cytochrome b subunit
MSQANDLLKSDKRILAEVNETLSNLGLRYGGGAEVKHLLNVLEEDYGFNRLTEKIKVSLDNLNVAAFYGCHLLRPARCHRNKIGEPRGSMETLIETLGGRVVDGLAGKVCCGFPVLLTNEQLAVKMAGDYLKRLKDEGADCIATPCPLCHISFDMYQGKVESALDVKIDLPVLHLSQLIGLGLGLNARQLMTHRNAVSTEALLKRIGL